MRKSFLISVMVLLFGLTFSEKVSGDRQIREKKLLRVEHKYVPNEIIVKFKKDVREAVIANINSRYGVSTFYTSWPARFKRLRIPKMKRAAEMVELYRTDPNVEYAELNYIAYAFMIPNDNFYSYQWHLDNPEYGGIGMEEAWDISTGAGAVVAVIDTGIAYEDYDIYGQAPDLGNTCFTAGYDFVNDDEHPDDDEGHGTHVAGTIAQSTNNALGVAGVAFDACLMPVKVLDSSGSGAYTDVADGIYFAVDNGAHVINLSLGGSAGSQTLKNAVKYAYENGVTVIAAAGNNRRSIAYPAAYDDYVIAVGATRYDEGRAYYSGTGKSLDVVAPGGDLRRDQNADGYGDGIFQQTHNGSDYTEFSYWFYQGTSMAAPHVSGVAALFISDQAATTGYYPTPDEVREALQSTAEDKGAAGWDKYYGWGLIDAYAVLGWSSVPDTDPPTPNPATFASAPAAISSSQITMTATIGTDASGPVEYYFAETSGNPDGTDSGWTTNPVYSDTGLNPGTQYTYTVQMRDSIPNVGTASSPTSATTDVALDTDPPAPDPMTWAAEPSDTGTTSISMVATTASDVSGVEYYFECTAGGGNDSGWQDSDTYEDTGLNPDTQYTYRIKARDKSDNQNETAYSTEKSATTQNASGWSELTNDDFESGWGSYSDGGGDCRRNVRDSGYAHQGTYCARIRDNSGTASSFYYTNGVNVASPGYTQIKVEFWYYPRKMESGEDFWVQYYDGSQWHTVATYARGTDFENNSFYQVQGNDIVINKGTYGFPTNMKIRFMCDASGNSDYVYIDEVVISAR